MDTLCRIRDVYRSIAEFEARFHEQFGLCLNEGMVLCSLNRNERLLSGELAEMMGLTASNTSKIIKSVESKGLINRSLGDSDRRQMYFSLTSQGRQMIEDIRQTNLELPEILQNSLAAPQPIA